MADKYDKLSDGDKKLIDKQIDANIKKRKFQGHDFGKDPKEAEEDEKAYRKDMRGYYSDPKNLKILQEQEKKRQLKEWRDLEKKGLLAEGMQDALNSFAAGGGQVEKGSIATIPGRQEEKSGGRSNA